jgi:hypothetical protein
MISAIFWSSSTKWLANGFILFLACVCFIPPQSLRATVPQKEYSNAGHPLKGDDDFIDNLARDTWAYLNSDWATDNHLPWSWRSESISSGDYANPSEIGLYALSWISAYEMKKAWSPEWDQVEAEITAILNQLRAWQTGSQNEQPHGTNSYNNSVFYQWYWIRENPPVVGGGLGDRVVPSIDNAWLAVSLITIREYAIANNISGLHQKADAILDDMDFTIWYDADSHRFFLGDVDNPQGGSQADYYSNENRIINFVTRALRQLSIEEYILSLEALEQPSATYSGITVDKVAWDGSYFTYTTPALFINEMNTLYGKSTILPATQSQITYASSQGYDAWGFSDCFDVEDGVYVQQGAPPTGMPGSPEIQPGLVTPYSSALSLITPLSSEAIANLQNIANTFNCAYDPNYGFRDSVSTDPVSENYGKCSDRFSALAQELIFLSIANYESNFIWDYFYRNPGVVEAHAEMFGDQKIYLPLVLNTVPPLVVADFDSCGSRNNLGGEMGAAFNPPDFLGESYVKEQERGCVAKLNYQITDWSAFWMKLQLIDLTSYGRLEFDIKAAQPRIPQEIKVELKRNNKNEVSIAYISGITTDWQTMSVNLSDFGPTGYTDELSSFTRMGELVFTFEADHSGNQGIVYLDNVTFK